MSEAFLMRARPLRIGPVEVWPPIVLAPMSGLTNRTTRATASRSLPQVALVAGLVYGAVGQTEELVRRMRGVIGERARVIAAGGMAGVVAAETSVIECVEPHLMLHGLRCDHIAGAGTG